VDLPLTYNKFEPNLKVKRKMKISELARKAGVPTSTIRFYEEQGLLEPAKRGPNNYRHYTDSALRQLQMVRVSQSLGFTLETIRGFFDDDGGGCNCERVLVEIGKRIEAAKREQAALDEQLKQLAMLTDMIHDSTEGNTVRCNGVDH
jgi:MerR family copper efflux transcriptional regulator